MPTQAASTARIGVAHDLRGDQRRDLSRGSAICERPNAAGSACSISAAPSLADVPAASRCSPARADGSARGRCRRSDRWTIASGWPSSAKPARSAWLDRLVELEGHDRAAGEVDARIAARRAAAARSTPGTMQDRREQVEQIALANEVDHGATSPSRSRPRGAARRSRAVGRRCDLHAEHSAGRAPSADQQPRRRLRVTTIALNS